MTSTLRAHRAEGHDGAVRWAVEPDEQGVAVRDGVRLAWSAWGPADRPTVLLVPTWSLVPARFWRAQTGHLSRHFRVVTFDGRGAGASDRPVGAAAYTDGEYAADILAVLDATGTGAAVLVALSCGVAWSVHVAAAHPDRVLGLVALAPACGFAVPDARRDGHPWDRPQESYEGWGTYNRHFWLAGGYGDFLDFFARQMFAEPHSTKQVEDVLAWGREVEPATLADTVSGRLGCDGAVCAPLEPLCAQVRCPVTVVHGTDDRVRPHAIAERLADLTGGSLLLVEGAGHGLPAREPVLVNRVITEFVDRVCPRPVRAVRPRAAGRRRRALYLSSPIGLGHARRDAAIAAELRALRTDVDVDWLAQHPVTALLADRGERIHPASAALASESAHVEAEAGEHALHAFQAVRRMDAVLVHNFMVFADVVAAGHYDLVIADEAWDVDYFLHENPELKRFAFAWLTDFVGWLPMPSGGAREAALTADLNAEMLEQRARFARVRDRSVFVGDPEDVVPDAFGPGLPSIREWTESQFDFAGYVTGFDPLALDGARERARLGARDDETLCLVTVGGSGVGTALLRRVLDAVPAARRRDPSVRFLVVTGPRIDPASLPAVPGVEVVGYVPDLHRTMAACDVAVVQGGLTTCMELTALGTPFVYVPLENHFEQNLHVRHRLDRHGAGHHLPWPAATPDALAAALLTALHTPPTAPTVDPHGATRAATLLSALL